ncbi:hypothetical protein Ahy_A09g043085 [Arachis hypogaea]|uniref:FAR1 domain-containing protein n=1 Tax=Arachis hypogaea TaxID=3818 RepID=A0A445BHI6_ARAHY|nr:hypothetical protein Ahy_A09g043085 [Arachis hypogaea]
MIQQTNTPCDARSSSIMHKGIAKQLKIDNFLDLLFELLQLCGSGTNFLSFHYNICKNIAFDKMVDLIGESSHNHIENVSVEEMEELLVDSDGIDVENLLLNSTRSIGRVNFVGLSVNAAKKYVFLDFDVSYAFYNAFEKINGFLIRKFKVGGVDETKRKRAPKSETRCGCIAQMRVHIDVGRDWWYETLFQSEHNHELMPPTLSRMLRSQRRMTDEDSKNERHKRCWNFHNPNIYAFCRAIWWF